MNKKILIAGSVLGFLAVVLGAFAAHGLENSITKDAIETFQTGVRYQMYHAIVLLFVGGTTLLNAKTKKWMYYFVVLGVLLFSGSIYGLATNELTSFDFKTIGFVTPIGGLLLIISWVLMLIDFIKLKVE
ncbi:FIG00018398: hypothetical regulator [hydrothermal vent metagenome]|uniref:FIG00018398: hypothetical regulator n=1 Tax=hydrothermal vent metagenome TaxID=652676 RepID=A0A3B0RJ95_9ZZZZ